MPTRAEYFRTKAAECEEKAKAAKDPEAKRMFLNGFNAALQGGGGSVGGWPSWRINDDPINGRSAAADR
jgi:hypothetical protein